jgi:hypothetical protein
MGGQFDGEAPAVGELQNDRPVGGVFVEPRDQPPLEGVRGDADKSIG